MSVRKPGRLRNWFPRIVVKVEGGEAWREVLERMSPALTAPSYLLFTQLVTAWVMIQETHPEVGAARRAMTAADNDKEYTEAKGKFDRLHNAAHQDVMTRIMEAPPNGANTFRRSREKAQRSGVRPQRTIYD